jgi:hypothetical protein
MNPHGIGERLQRSAEYVLPLFITTPIGGMAPDDDRV